MAEHGHDDLIGPQALADWFGVPLQTVYRWNHTGDGPTPISVGRHVRYMRSDCLAWLQARRQQRDGQPAA